MNGLLGETAQVYANKTYAVAHCWACRWQGTRHEGRGRMKRSQLAMSLHTCRSPRHLTREQALAAGETL
jgi:hypothetical protein